MDSPVTTGRRTKRKWKTGAAVLAVLLALSGAWLSAYWETIKPAAAGFLYGMTARRRDQWVDVPEGMTSVSWSGRGVLMAGDGRLCLVDQAGGTRWQTALDLDEPMICSCGEYAAVYQPGQDEIWIAGTDGSKRLEIPQGIDGAAIGPDGQLAVITAGSGYLTETNLFSPDGIETGRIGLTDSAMAMAVFLPDGALVSCCVSTDGRWRLRIDRAGTCSETDLSPVVVYDLRRCGTGVALWTCDGIAFFDDTGRETGTFLFRDSELISWDCGDFAAVLLRGQKNNRLAAVTPEGEVVVFPSNARSPVEVAACGRRVCLLDRESLLVYDRAGVLLEADACGARAGHIRSAGQDLLLLGDGQMRFHAIP